MNFSPLAISLSLMLATNIAWSQVPLDKDRAATIVNQVLTERGITLQSTDDGGTRFKSQPFKFDSESQVHYQGSYSFLVENGEIKVTVTDIKFASGLPSIFPVSGKVLAGLTGSMQQRLLELAGGTAAANQTPGRASGKTASAGAGPAFNANGEPMTPSPNGLVPGHLPGERLPAVTPATGDQLARADIAGLNLNMSAAQAQKLLAGKARWVDRPLKTVVTTDYRQQVYTVGDLQYRCVSAGACKVTNAVESMTIYALPNQPDLVGIYRVRRFGEKEKPLLSETIKSLRDKYGKETFHTPDEMMSYSPRFVLRWTTNIPGGVQGSINGLSPVDLKSPTGCPMDFLPEAPLPDWGDPRSFYGGNDIDANMPLLNGSGFFKDVNRVLRKERPLAGCGTLMGVVLTLDANRDYVSRMETGVLDYARLDTELQVLANAFVKDSEGARAQKQGEDKTRKPDL